MTSRVPVDERSTVVHAIQFTTGDRRASTGEINTEEGEGEDGGDNMEDVMEELGTIREI